MNIHHVTKFQYICVQNKYFSMVRDINRLKVVLAEKKRTNKWLAEELGINQTTVSKWCTNSSQPDLYTLTKIAKLLGVSITHLINDDIVE